MALSNQQLMDVLAFFESSPDPHEVRRAARVSVRRPVTIITDPQSDAGTKEVVLQDISRGGVRITHHDALARDARFLLLLPSRGGSSVEVPCTVRHCEMLKQHLFRIGAEFDLSETAF